LLINDKTDIVYWLFNKAKLTETQKDQLISTKGMISDNGKQTDSLISTLLLSDKSKVSWLLYEAGLTQKQKELFLFAPSEHSNGKISSLIHMLTLNEKLETVDWLLNEVGLTKAETDRLLSEPIVSRSGHRKSLLFELKKSNHQETIDSLMDTTVLTWEQKEKLVTAFNEDRTKYENK